MKYLIKKIFPRLALYYQAYSRLIKDNDSYLHSTGWLQSVAKQKPIDKDGNPIPWMNYPVVKFLEDRLTDDINLFEFGSGYSTFFYAKKVMSVTSLEYDESWFKLIKSQIPSNVQLIYKEKDIDGAYCRAIGDTDEKYDVVIVDGRDRVNCVKKSVSALSSKGVILLDDSQRERYKEAIEFAREMDFRVLSIEGLKATGSGVDRTTILYREDNCLGI